MVKVNEEEIMFKTPCIVSSIHQILNFVLILAMSLTHDLIHKCNFLTAHLVFP